MAPASPSAVLAVSERPLPERPEAKSTDGSDGQFAGLMAQFNHPPPPPPKPTDNHPSGQARVDKEAMARPSEDKPTAPPPAATSAKAPDKPQPKADSTNTKAEPADTNTQPPKADPDPANVSVGLPVTPVKDAGLLVVESLLQASLAADTSSKVPIAATPTTTATNPENLAPAATAPTALPTSKALAPPTGSIPLQITPAAAPVAPKVDAPTALPPSLPTPTEAKVDPTPQVDAVHLPPAIVAQAALAEQATGSKNNLGSETSTAIDDTPKSDSTRPVGNGPKSLGVPTLGQPALPAAIKAPLSASPLINEQEAASVASKAKSASIDPNATLPTFESLAAKANLATQTPSVHASDGSAMAALNSVSRTPLEAAPAVAAPVAPAATPPTPPSPQVFQVEGGIRWMLKGGAQEAQLQLHPESLGQVTIHLKVEGGEVHARLWVTEPASVQAVQEGRAHLEQSLKDQGLQLGSFDLHQGNRPFHEAPSAPAFREPTSAEPLITRQEAPSMSQPSILNTHHVELYA
jgi:flagellar hook-length control protein FliK